MILNELHYIEIYILLISRYDSVMKNKISHEIICFDSRKQIMLFKINEM